MKLGALRTVREVSYVAQPRRINGHRLGAIRDEVQREVCLRKKLRVCVMCKAINKIYTVKSHGGARTY